MHAHTATPVRDGHRSRAAWLLPLLIGVAYGAYAWFLASDDGFTARAAAVGLASGVLLALISFAVGRFRRVLPRGLRAVLYGTVFGIAMGFLFSLSGPSVLSAAIFGLVLGAGMFAVCFYYFYTHELPAEMGIHQRGSS